MKVFLKDYEYSRKKIVEQYADKGEYRTLELAVSSNIPLVVVYTFLKDEFGGFEKEIEDLVKFYRYSEIE